MNVWSKLITALRGGVNEAGEAIVDSQALRILDQELRDASEEIKISKQGLASIIVHQKVAEEKAEGLKVRVNEYEEYTKKALEKEDEALALELAQKIADFERQQEVEEQSSNGFFIQANTLRGSIQQAEMNIRRMKQQVDTVKATESVQRAQEAVAERYSGSDSRLRTAMDSLERIKEKQAIKEATIEAAEEMAEDRSEIDLESRLRAAGISPSGNDAQNVLDRLKAR